MKNTKSTKRALLSAILALVMTVSMLVGTTFAWFTDSVTSSGNKIVAGNLDVELHMFNASSGAYENISDATKPIFGADGLVDTQEDVSTIWEPGKTQVVYLAIRNAGTLDLNYRVSLDVTNIEKDLNKVLSYTITPDAKAPEGKLTAWNGADAKSVAAGSQIVSESKVALDSGAWHYFALSVHMDELAGNEYMNGSITFDLTILASQRTSEKDSFGEDYDDDATFPVDINVAAPVVSGNDTSVAKEIENSELSKVEASIPEEALADGVTEVKLSVKETETPHANVVIGADKRSLNYDISVTGLAEGNTTPVEVTLTLPTGLLDVVLYHNGEVIPSTYDIVTGELTFSTASFSPFSVVFGEMLKADVSDADDLAGALENGGNISIEGVINPEVVDKYEFTIDGANGDYILSGGELVFDNNVNRGLNIISGGKNIYISNVKINSNADWSVHSNNKGGLVNLRDVEIVAVDGAGLYAYGNSSGTTILDNVKVNHEGIDGDFAADYPWGNTAFATSGGHNVVINGGVYYGKNVCVWIYNSGGNVTINGGNFKAETVLKADGVWSGSNKSVITVNGGNFDGKLGFDWGTNVPEIHVNGGNFTNFGVSLVEAGKVVIKGGTFDADPSKYVAEGYVALDNGNGTWTVKSAAVYLSELLANGGTVVLDKDYVVNEPIVVPAGVTVTLDLNGKTISGTMHKNVGSVIKNEGELTVTNGTIKSIGANGGSAILNKGNLIADGVVLNGAPNADGSWPSYTINNTGVAQLDNCYITSYHGSVASYNEGALVTLNNSEINMVGIDGFTSHGIYTYSNGAVIVNGGKIANYNTTQNSSGASAINGAVTINGAEVIGRVENYYGTPVINSGSFTVKPNASFIKAGYEAAAKDDIYYIVPKGFTPVSTADELLAALADGKDVCFANDITVAAGLSNAYGTTAINVLYGQTIDGNGYTLNVTGANGTWDSAISTTGGTIKNLTIAGGFRGVFVNHTSEYSEKVVLENVVIGGNGTVYTISCDQGLYQGIEATNCTFNGWTSFAATAGEAKFVNCSFGEGSGYAFCRPYSNTEFVGCTFSEGYAVDTTCATVTFTDCANPNK